MGPLGPSLFVILAFFRGQFPYGPNWIGSRVIV